MKVLLYLQSCHGHRIMYALVFVDWAKKKGYSVLVVSPDIKVWDLQQEGVKIVVSSSSDHLVNLTSAEKEFSPDISLLANADLYIRNREKDLIYHNAPKRIIIANSTLWAHDLEKENKKRSKYYLHTFLSWYRGHKKNYLDRKYYCNKLPNMVVAEAILSMDEYYVNLANHKKVQYIPDIYTAHSRINNSTVKANFQLSYEDFIKSNKGREVVLYLGEWQERRGILNLLKLVHRNTNRVFVCLGRKSEKEIHSSEVLQLYSELFRQGRAYMSNTRYIEEGEFLRNVFASISYVVLPYRGFNGASGSLISAASFGKPVLVPNYGHMQKTVKKYNIGICYKAGDIDSMECGLDRLLKAGDEYRDRCLDYASLFSKENVYRALDRAVEKCV